MLRILFMYFAAIFTITGSRYVLGEDSNVVSQEVGAAHWDAIGHCEYYSRKEKSACMGEVRRCTDAHSSDVGEFKYCFVKTWGGGPTAWVDEVKARDKEEAEKQRAALLFGMKEKSKQTREQVMKRGARICKVSLEAIFPGYTEDQAEGKIKVLYQNNMFWDWPDNWYLCDERPQQ